jgi:hypothetical protein
MDNPKNARELKAQILLKEQHLLTDKKNIIEQFTLTRHALRPLNLIDNMLNNTPHKADLKIQAVNIVGVLIAGYIERKLTEKKQKNSEAILLKSLVEISIEQNRIEKTNDEKALDELLLKKLIMEYVVNNHSNA